LDEPVQPDRRAAAVGDPAADDAADRHPAEVAGQDRRDRLGRVPEDEDELARPDDLVDQARGARQDEDREDEPRVAHRRSVTSAAGPWNRRAVSNPLRIADRGEFATQRWYAQYQPPTPTITPNTMSHRQPTPIAGPSMPTNSCRAASLAAASPHSAQTNGIESRA